MSISFDTSHYSFILKEKTKLRKWISAVIDKHGKKTGDVSYLFCDDKTILDYNQRYLNHDTYTDIITFDYVVNDTISGDILISIDRVGENAIKFPGASRPEGSNAATAESFEQELHRVMIHGVLHLLGYPDKSPKEAATMRCKEDEALKMWDLM